MSQCTSSFLHNIGIAKPCRMNWKQMTGDDRVRFCGRCQLNVYNISEMSLEEAEGLIISKEEKVCLRLLRRSDGTVIARECSGAKREEAKKAAGKVGCMLALVAALAGLFRGDFVQSLLASWMPRPHDCPRWVTGQIAVMKAAVVVAGRDIQAGETIAPGSIELRDVEAIKTPIDAITVLDGVCGKKALYRIPAGSIVSTHSISK